MRNQGEITDIKNSVALVRIYKNGEPTSLTVNAKMNGNFSVADTVELEINAFMFFLCTALSYIAAFVAVIFAYIITDIFTDNTVILEIAILVSLLLSYIFASLFEKSKLFEKMTVCTILNKK